ncbi:non-specific lipid transfer protein GPI-anchored 13 [Mercurialis annua]|uniref:non-specific lipid transfer protein GPI-anchored 13 n=1 Tax=Mercurialis annua TaxID=3986 RepID=UPI00215DFD84|nr:non-specific lipid transfer protein GPI-anchored 13 [Mercurialis annua]
MSSKYLVVVTLVVMGIGFGGSDIAKDKAECASQLVGLAPCLPYVGGTAKAPTLDCCTGLKQVLDKSKRCLCLLIKDRNDPDLGLHVNATLAASLPVSCHAPSNITQCIDLLHLPPSSPDAKMFAGFANITAMSANTSPVGSSGNSSRGTSSDDKSGSEISKRSKWVILQIICGIWLLPLISFVF